MKTRQINIQNIFELEELGFSKVKPFYAKYYIEVLPIGEKYLNYINKNDKSRRKKLGEVIQRSADNHLNKGDIVLKATSNGEVTLKIVNEKTKRNSFTDAYKICDDSPVTAQYILWYISQTPVRDYLGQLAIGSVIPKIPRESLEDLIIILPKIQEKKKGKTKISFTQKDSSVREIIREYYQDYQLNYNSKRFKSAIIIAGAICEAILYESLVELGVPEKILSNNKTLGSLIEYAEIKELNIHYGINLTHFYNIMKNRNKTVHVGSALKGLENGEVLKHDVFNDFNKIIDVFGI